MNIPEALRKSGIAAADIPEWARWVAQDADGCWWAFEAEPNEGDLAWYENEVGRYQRLGSGKPNTDWQSALKKLDLPNA